MSDPTRGRPLSEIFFEAERRRDEGIRINFGEFGICAARMEADLKALRERVEALEEIVKATADDVMKLYEPILKPSPEDAAKGEEKRDPYHGCSDRCTWRCLCGCHVPPRADVRASSEGAEEEDDRRHAAEAERAYREGHMDVRSYAEYRKNRPASPNNDAKHSDECAKSMARGEGCLCKLILTPASASEEAKRDKCRWCEKDERDDHEHGDHVYMPTSFVERWNNASPSRPSSSEATGINLEFELAKIARLREECAAPDWDCERGDGIPNGAWRGAEVFVAGLIASGATHCFVSPGGDGHAYVSYDDADGSRRCVSIVCEMEASVKAPRPSSSEAKPAAPQSDGKGRRRLDLHMHRGIWGECFCSVAEFEGDDEYGEFVQLKPGETLIDLTLWACQNCTALFNEPTDHWCDHGSQRWAGNGSGWKRQTLAVLAGAEGKG